MYIIYAVALFIIYYLGSLYIEELRFSKKNQEYISKLSNENKKLQCSLEEKEKKLLEKKAAIEKTIKQYDDMFSYTEFDIVNLNENTIDIVRSEKIFKGLFLPTKISNNQLEKYIGKIKDNREKRMLLADNKPIISAAVENGAFDDRSWIKRYKEECLFVQKEKGLVAPSIPKDGIECKIIKNIDGDTVWVSIPSLNIDKIKVRVVGYDTPESHKPGHGIYHGAYEACIISDKLIANASSVWIRYDKEQAAQDWLFDKYGRLLAHIYLDNKPLGLSLIEEGYAFYMDAFPMESSFHIELAAAEGMARADNKGMWDSLNKLNERELKKVKFGLNEFITKYSELVTEETRLRDALNYMLGSIVMKSKKSSIVHNPDCRHLNTIKSSNLSNIEIDSNNLGNIFACKTCGSDILKELL